MELLQAEVSVALDELKVIIGLAVLALVLAILMGLLAFIGSALFLGEWLFGSIFWGVADGVLLIIAFIVPIGINLAGGSVRAWTQAFIVALVLGILMAIVFWLNWAHNAAVSFASQLQPSLNINPNWLVWLASGVVVGIVLGIVFAGIGLRLGLRRTIALFFGGFVVGFLVGAFFGYVRFTHREAIALAFTLGLILWVVFSGWFAVRRGFDTEARYANLVPRESMAQFAVTQAYLVEQWQRQRKKLSGK